MAAGAIRKKCVECRRVFTGDRDRAQWCPECGGEMRAIPYANRRKARRVG